MKTNETASQMGIDHRKERHKAFRPLTNTVYIINERTNEIIIQSRVLLEKLLVLQLVKTPPTLSGTRGLITVFTEARPFSLS